MTQRLEEGRRRGPRAAEAEDGKRNVGIRGGAAGGVLFLSSVMSLHLSGAHFHRSVGQC